MFNSKECEISSRGGHNYHKISTFPFQSKIYAGKGLTPRDESLDIIIEDDVWIGYDSIILSGARVGKGSVIGARSVVTGVIPPYSVYVANKVIKKRFNNDVISQLMPIDFANIRHSLGDSYEKYCNSELSADNIDSIIEAFTE